MGNVIVPLYLSFQTLTVSFSVHIPELYSTFMKIRLLTFIGLISAVSLISGQAHAQLGVGTLEPDPSAQLEVSSTEKGVLVPRMTSVQRAGINSPANGLLVYDTDTKDFWYYKSGTGWAKVDNAPLTLPYKVKENNEDTLFSITSKGGGIAGNFMIDKAESISPAVKGEVNTKWANFGAAGIFGVTSGTAGYGGLFYSSHLNGTGAALVAYTNGNGNGIITNAKKNGNGIEATANGTGAAVYGWTPSFGIGTAGKFANFNDENDVSTVDIRSNGIGTALFVRHTGSSGNLAVFQSGSVNVARIGKNGTGYFNGAVQPSGADVAEAFEAMEEPSQYEPGDVLVIATEKDRTVEKSKEKYSSLVLGVYATKPGVLLTDQIDSGSEITDRVPMGVIGVIPTKVCLEGGTIVRGDLLVTSSTRGVAMKADPEKVKPGQIIGKALQNFDGAQVGKINVFVNVK